MTRIATAVALVLAASLASAAHASLPDLPPEGAGAPLTAQAVSLAQVSNPVPTASQEPSTGQERALPPCAVEDGSSGPIPCRWQADKVGNKRGLSFTIIEPGVFVYDDGHTEYDDTATPDNGDEGEGYGP